MKDIIRDLTKNKLAPALLSIALGIIIIVARRAALDLLVKIIGGLVITCGVAFAASYLTGHGNAGISPQMVIAPCATAVLIGIVLIIFAENVVDFFPTMMGIFLILNGLSHLTEASVDGENRIIVGAMGIVVIIFGLLIVMRPGFVANALMVFIGAFFIINGLFDLFMVKKINGGGF